MNPASITRNEIAALPTLLALRPPLKTPDTECTAAPKTQVTLMRPAPVLKPETAVDRFRDSMVIDYNKWHDGVGYDLEILKTAAPEELLQIETLLINCGVHDWRDVQALAVLGSSRARFALRQAWKSHDYQLRAAVIRHAPQLLSSEERTATLVAALAGAEIDDGLTQTLDQVAEFHPPEVIFALFRGTLERAGDIAVHYAAMLMFLYGKSRETFDWAQRPFFLRFNTPDRGERETAFRELCDKVGIVPEQFIAPPRQSP